MKRLLAFALVGFILFLAAPSHGAPVPELVTQLRDKDTDIRRAAAKQLGEAGPDAKEAVPALVKALKDEDAYVRRFSALALGDIKSDPATVVPALAAVLNNPREKKEVQEAAATALGKLGAGGTGTLSKVIKDSDREVIVRRRAIEALAAIGPDAHAAVPDLTDVLNGKVKMDKKADPNAAANDVRLEVIDALARIANKKDEAALKALEDLATNKQTKGPLKDASRKAAQQIKNRD
jgi:HEAT repeat protein